MEFVSCEIANLTSLIRGLFISNAVLSRMVLFSACKLLQLEEVPVVEVADAIFQENRPFYNTGRHLVEYYGGQI